MSIVTAIFVLVASAITVSIAAGGQQPPSAALRRLQMDGAAGCASPCVMGTTLGKTTYNDALTWFQKGYDTPKPLTFDHILPEAISFRMMDPNGQAIANEVTVLFSGGVVSSVKIEGVLGTGNGTMPTLGDLVSKYGSPQCAQSNPPVKSSFGNIQIVDSRLGIEILISGWYHMSWDTPVGSLTVLQFAAARDSAPCVCQRRWQGARNVTPSPDGSCIT